MTPFSHCYITHTESFLPGEPVGNEEMDRYIGPINRISGRIKARVLAENGIRQRHYAIDTEGRSLHSVASMGASVAQALLAGQDAPGFLAAATTGGDAAAPGLASQIHGALALPPLEALSVSGICAASVGALAAAAQAVEHGGHASALALASEFPSRLFKTSRFVKRAAEVDFDAHFLRWMLSDGAGGVRLARAPAAQGLSLRVRWIHQRSFAGDMPTCMQVGMSPGNALPGYLDFPTLAEAERHGAFDLRQDIRILPNLFDLCLHEYAALVRAGHLDPQTVSWFLCHYSSERFKPVMARLMDEAGLTIPHERWYSNLQTRGNTGAASIFIMLDEFMRTHAGRLVPGQHIFGFVPESGRFSVAFFLLEVVDAGTVTAPAAPRIDAQPAPTLVDEAAALAPAPVSPAGHGGAVADMLTALMAVWHDYRSAVFRTPLAQAVLAGEVTRAQYLAWMEAWIPQVREGSLWMCRAVSSMTPRYGVLRETVRTHADEEQLDWQVLYDDYRQAGGRLPATALARNPGGEALNAFMHGYAARPDPVGLLGGIYIIEGTGQRIVPTLAPRLKTALGLSSGVLRFIDYHGDNDQAHMARWLGAVKLVAQIDPAATEEIVRVASSVATLYLQQWQYVDMNASPEDANP